MKCKACGEDVDVVVRASRGGKTIKVCEDCAERIHEEAEIGREAEGVIGRTMEYKGGRG
ncbi:MAG: hypothetical protein IT379_34765 [Deltaproteobacteria bacterium]|nr:hypothetical protein [Deltaproteobacteria bacterium]